MKKSTVKSTKGRGETSKSKKSIAGLSKKGSGNPEVESQKDEQAKSQKSQSRYDQTPEQFNDDASMVQHEMPDNSDAKLLANHPAESQLEIQENEVQEEAKVPDATAEVPAPVENQQEDDDAAPIVQQPERQESEKQQASPNSQGPELALQPNMTKDTRGANLGQHVDDFNKSFAMTEKMQQDGEDFFEEPKAQKFDQLTEINKKPQGVNELNDEDLQDLNFMETIAEKKPPTIDDQIKLVRESWQSVKDLGLDRVGQLLFRNIFKLAPEVLQLFSFKDEPNLYQSEKFKSHALKVMNAVGKSIKGFDDLESLSAVLKQLGMMHAHTAGVQKEHYPVVMQALDLTLKACLKTKYTKELREAWLAVLKVVEDAMIADNYDEPIPRTEDGMEKKMTGKQSLEESPEAQDAQGANSNELNEFRIKLIQDSWGTLTKKKDFGIKLFKNLFTMYPETLQLFSFRKTKNLYESHFLQSHAEMVLKSLDEVIKALGGSMDSIKYSLAEKGKDHAFKDVKREHYEQLGEALIKTIEQESGQGMTQSVRQAWIVAYQVLAGMMIGNNYGSIQKEEQHDQSIRSSLMDNGTGRQLMDQDDEDIGIPMRKNTIQVLSAKDEAGTKDLKNEVKEHYLRMFRKEVDFHHKIAYRFEKAYRLGKKTNQRKQTLNLEIIDCISEHSGYIEQDPMALFYSLFFCIYYKNEDLVEFLRTLIHKIHSHDKIDKLLEYIDVNGIDRIRTVGEPINSMVYHMVFYQAVDDDLRIVYAQIFRQLRFIQLRDKDALQFLNQRDYELIRLSFDKYTTKLNLTLFFDKAFPLKASTYRKYNQAYYEEIVINNDVESRVAQNYRERFLVSAEDIYIVFEMYCKEDYWEQFQKTKKDGVTSKQFIELFIICLRNDSYQIAILIYTLYLNPAVDMDQKMMDILMSTIRESSKYHEMKLFLIHEHFDVLSIGQMNYLVDIYQEIVHKDAKLNPIINCFNTIKLALLIYRICWKIEKKQIYSLITKCSLLQSYLITSLSNYFEKQNNILVLYKFMSEPILHMTERKDSLDIMYEMNMQELLKHPVVVEVLNLVFEGKYSVSSSALSMSQTFQCMADMDSMALKSINERLIANIINFGDTGSSKQTSLQYNIWKQSIQQRERDEMIFTILISFVLIFLSIVINQIMNNSFQVMQEKFGGDFAHQTSIFLNSDDATILSFCEIEMQNLKNEFQLVTLLQFFMLINTIGMFTSVLQKLVAFRFKDNVTLNYGQMSIEASISAVGIIFLIQYNQANLNTLITDVCGRVIPEISPEDSYAIDKMFTMRYPREGELNFKLIASTIIIQSSMISVIMLQRTQYLGELIMMLDQMKNELIRFFATFGLIIVSFLLVGRMLGSELKYENATFWEVFMDLFNAFNGNQNFADFKMPIGQSYIAVFMYIFKVLLMSLLAAMFINKYKEVWRNLDAYRRFNIIKLKNSVSYDKYIGGVTLTFFPINILMLPFIPFIVFFRSARASDFLLKLQYGLMMVMYCILAGIIIVPFSPILYMKVVANAIFIAINNKRQDYKGQNIIQLITAIFGGPFFIAISMIIDLTSLPGVLLRDSRGFEHKYQLSTDRLNDAQIHVVMVTFIKIFYNGNFQRFKGKHMTLIELMEMHRKIFNIIDNMHDLMCRGNKDYKESLSNVQDYNMTKILTRKCSIPDKGGDYKQGRCELDIIYAVQMDIELYNYVDGVLRKLRMGKLEQEMIDKAKGAAASGEGEQGQEADEQAKQADDNGDDEEDDELKKVDGIQPIGIGPDGVPFKRNNSDVMNNFFIQYCALSFTEIEKELQALKNNGDLKRQMKFEQQIEVKKTEWKKLATDAFQQQNDKYETYVKRQLGMEKQITQKSGESKTQSTTSNDHSSTENIKRGKTAKTQQGPDVNKEAPQKQKGTKHKMKTGKF